MNNPEKLYRIVDNASGNEFHMPRKGYEDAFKNPNFNWKLIGLVQPDDIQETWFVSEDQRNLAIISGKPFCEHSRSDSYFKIIKRIDNTFIEGHLGRNDLESSFFSEIASNYSYFDYYLKRQKVYFTFDRISLYQVTEIFKENPLRLILKRLDNLPNFKSNTAFMIMPFGEKELDDFYETHIRQFLKEKFNIDIYRADNFTDNDIIIETIYKSIEESEFVIAETTINNKNSFYELGYAVAKGKEVITIQNRKEKNIFFDRSHVRSILYSNEEIEKFRADLFGTVQTIRKRI